MRENDLVNENDVQREVQNVFLLEKEGRCEEARDLEKAIYQAVLAAAAAKQANASDMAYEVLPLFDRTSPEKEEKPDRFGAPDGVCMPAEAIVTLEGRWRAWRAVVVDMSASEDFVFLHLQDRVVGFNIQNIEKIEMRAMSEKETR